MGSPSLARKRTSAFYSHWEDLVSKFINEFSPTSRTKNLRNEISNVQQRFDESFHEAWDRYKDLLRACPHHGFIEFHQLDSFYNALNSADQDSLNSAAGGNLLERCTQDVLTIIENKSKVRNSRIKSIVSQVKSSDANSSSFSEIAKLNHAVNQQTSVVTTAMTTILKQFQATSPPASVKAVEEICVTCGGAHPYYQCLAADANTFLELWDNIQGYISAAAVNYNQGNFSYRPSGVANQIRPPASMSNQTNELKNMMASFFQMNTTSTSGSGPLPSNIIANPKGELKAITTRSGIVLDGPFVPIPPSFINPEEDECVEEALTDPKLAITTRSGIVLDGPFVPIPPSFINPEEDECVEEALTDPKLGEFTIKVSHPLVQKPKPHFQRNVVVYQRDPLHHNIPYPSRMHKQKQQEKDEVQIHKFWQMFKQLHINITLADALILILKYQKMLKALLSNKEKLLELANTPFNENCSTVILKKLPEKLGDPEKFLSSYGFSELKCKALADLGASFNLMRLFISKKLGLPKLISTRMTFELANRAICTPARIARDVFVPVGKFTFLADFVIVDYESNPRVPLIFGRPFLRTAHALTDVHGEEMILRDGDERLTLNIRHDTSSYSNQPQKESIIMINIYDDSYDIFDPEGDIVLDSTKDLPPPHNINPLSVSTTSSSPNHLLKEFEMDSILKDSVDEDNLTEPNDNLVNKIPEMFIAEHALDYSSPPLYDEYDDNLFEVESDTKYVYDDPFNSKEDEIKESKLLIDELDLPRLSDFLPSPGYDSFLFEDFSEVDALPLTNNEDKVFNPGILIHENLFEVIIRATPDKNVKKISNASLILKNFNPPL
uniref:Retrotransposon gag domain-containing protein n=1 Tax=Tanacetum cinerariifolium TaxID=118510 RepID=A0A6L2JS10_TANCI|nr:hypothetical protein [Tanacetum cinerariifolium]